MDNENLEEGSANRPADQKTGDKSAATLEATGDQKKESAGKEANKRPSDQSGEQAANDPAGLDNEGNKEVAVDWERDSTIAPEKTAKTVKEEFEGSIEPFKLSEELGGLLESEDLSDDFRAQATTIFEGAVNTILEAQHASMVERFGTALEEALELQESEIEAKVQRYIDYVAEQWVQENQIEIETGLKQEMNESIVTKIIAVLEEHNINIDEDQINVAEEERTARERAEQALEEQVDRNVDTSEQLAEARKLLALVHFSRENSLTMVEEEKLVTLAKSVVFENSDQFNGELTTLKESFLMDEAGSDVEAITEDLNGEVAAEDDAPKAKSEMDHYNDFFNQTFGR